MWAPSAWFPTPTTNRCCQFPLNLSRVFNIYKQNICSPPSFLHKRQHCSILKIIKYPGDIFPYQYIEFSHCFCVSAKYSNIQLYHNLVSSFPINRHLDCFPIFCYYNVLVNNLCKYIYRINSQQWICSVEGHTHLSFGQVVQIALHSSCVNLHFHQPCMKAPVSLQFCQHCAFSNVWIFANLIAEK